METAIIIILVNHSPLLKKANACFSYFNTLHRLVVTSGQKKKPNKPSSSLEIPVSGKASTGNLIKVWLLMITSPTTPSFRKKSTMKKYHAKNINKYPKTAKDITLTLKDE